MKIEYLIKILKTALTAVMLAVVGLLASPYASWALGPNMMANSGFEGGNQGGYINMGSTYNVYNDTSAYAGSWDVKANLTGGYSNFYQPVPVWTSTNYTSSIWYKGTGQISFNIIKGDWSGTIASTTITGSSSWQQVTLSYNTGSQTTVYVQCEDMATGTMYLDNIFTGLNSATDLDFNPSDPGASGFNSTLVNDSFTSLSTIDVNNTQSSGYLWYVAPWAGSTTTPSSDLAITSSALTISDGGEIQTAIPGVSSTGWMGTGWEGGSGIYIEASIAMQNVGNINSTAWPAFWLQDLTTESGVGDAMPGNSGHTEGVENDILEYNPSSGFWGSDDYASTLHDWTDGSGNLDNSNNALICPTVGTDFTAYHKYGMLWVPASSSNSYCGYRQCFFDGQPMAAAMWIGNQDYTAGVFPPTVASMGSYMFSDMDHHPLDLILSAGPGSPTVSIQYVHIYAASSSSEDVVTGTKYTTPAAPTSFVATAGTNQVGLTWTASSGATSYYVFRSTTSGSEALIATATSTSYTDTSVTDGTKYYYTVAATNPAGTSDWSSEQNATPTSGGSAPSIPGNLVATAGSGQVGLTWNTSSGATAYYVFRSTSSGTEVCIATVYTNSYTDTSVTNGTKYYYTVAANNSYGTSNWSNEVNATPTSSAGPNLISNPGFESGGSGWNDQAVFTQVNNSGNAHSGSWETVATLSSSASYDNFFQSNVPVSTSTNYTASVWVKGSGKLVLEVISGDWSTTLSSVNITATSTWQQVTVPTFSSGTSTTLIFLVDDSLGGTAGTVYLDDCYLGT